MTATYPRSQHWTVQGLRVSVLVYKTHQGPCVTCTHAPAIHAVWADGRGEYEGFRGGPAHFCDQHRPAKGTLPPLVYERLLQGGEGTIAYEGFQPYGSCMECGESAWLRYEFRCPGCDNPEHQYTVRHHGISEVHHSPHTVRRGLRCRAHALALVVAQ